MWGAGAASQISRPHALRAFPVVRLKPPMRTMTANSETPRTRAIPRPGAWHDWLTAGRFAIILAVCIFISYPEVVLGSHTFVFRDFGYFGYPVAFYHRQSFWRGEIPLWNPLNLFGLPFLAQWNTLVLYPGSLFYLLFPLTWSLAMFGLGHQFLAGLGMYLLSHRWARNRLAAAVAGMAFAFNGLTLNCLMWPNNIAALAWMPLVVLSVERAWQKGGRTVLSAAVIGAMQMLAGAPELILLTWLALGVLCLNAALSNHCWGVCFRRFFSVVVVVAGVTAIQMFPFLDLLRHSQRSLGFATDDSAMPATGWANLVVPLFESIRTAQQVYLQAHQVWTSSYYTGIGVLAFAVMGAWLARTRRVWLLAGMTVLGLVLALGDAGYLYKILRRAIPLFGFMRYPIKFVSLAVFCVPLLAGFAVRELCLSTE